MKILADYETIVGRYPGMRLIEGGKGIDGTGLAMHCSAHFFLPSSIQELLRFVRTEPDGFFIVPETVRRQKILINKLEESTPSQLRDDDGRLRAQTLTGEGRNAVVCWGETYEIIKDIISDPQRIRIVKINYTDSHTDRDVIASVKNTDRVFLVSGENDPLSLRLELAFLRNGMKSSRIRSICLDIKSGGNGSARKRAAETAARLRMLLPPDERDAVRTGEELSGDEDAEILLRPSFDYVYSNESMSILPGRCTGCGRCKDETGCEAVWKKGFRYYIDRTMCRGESCGRCREACPRKAVTGGEVNAYSVMRIS